MDLERAEASPSDHSFDAKGSGVCIINNVNGAAGTNTHEERRERSKRIVRPLQHRV